MTFVALRIHLHLVFDNFFQFLYVSYLVKDTGKYDIYYNWFMWGLFQVHLKWKLFLKSNRF